MLLIFGNFYMDIFILSDLLIFQTLVSIFTNFMQNLGHGNKTFILAVIEGCQLYNNAFIIFYVSQVFNNRMALLHVLVLI